jgi:hypothetical protein
MQAPLSYGKLFEPLHTKMYLKSPQAVGKSRAVGEEPQSHMNKKGKRFASGVVPVERQRSRR